MEKSNVKNYESRLMVDINGLQELLSCGKITANKIGDEAGAVMRFGRRKLFNVSKVREYLNKAN